MFYVRMHASWLLQPDCCSCVQARRWGSHAHAGGCPLAVASTKTSAYMCVHGRVASPPLCCRVHAHLSRLTSEVQNQHRSRAHARWLASAQNVHWPSSVTTAVKSRSFPQSHLVVTHQPLAAEPPSTKPSHAACNRNSKIRNQLRAGQPGTWKAQPGKLVDQDRTPAGDTPTRTHTVRCSQQSTTT